MDIRPETEQKLRGELPPQELPTANELREASKLAKRTERNDLCPCGCGLKAKKCENGRRVLEFKKYQRRYAMFDLLVIVCTLALVAVSIYCVATGCLVSVNDIFR